MDRMRTMRRDWRRLAIGVVTGVVLAVAGQIGLGDPLSLYSDEITYRADVGVFAYGEGRVQARAYWRSEEGDPFEELYVVAARGVGALTDRNAHADGALNHNDPPQSRPVSSEQSGEGEQAGEFLTFFAYHTLCGPDECLDEYIELPRGAGTLQFTFDPLLRRAEVHGFVKGKRFDIVWSSNNPLGPGGFAHTNHQAGGPIPDHPDWPYSGLAHASDFHEDALAEQSLGRYISSVEFHSTWAPTFVDPKPWLWGGDISYAAASRVNSGGGAGWGPFLKVEEPA